MAAVPDPAFVFQPLVSTANGSTVAVEAIARPSGRTLRQFLRAAAEEGHLRETHAALAASAVGTAPTPLPLHVNVLAPTAASAETLLGALIPAIRRAGRRPQDTTIEVGAPFTSVRASALVAGLHRLRDHGFGIALNGIGDADCPSPCSPTRRPTWSRRTPRSPPGCPATRRRWRCSSRWSSCAPGRTPGSR